MQRRIPNRKLDDFSKNLSLCKALEVTTDDYLPIYHNGDLLLARNDVIPKLNDSVAVVFKDGRSLFATYVSQTGSRIILRDLLDHTSTEYIGAAAVENMAKIISVIHL